MHNFLCLTGAQNIRLVNGSDACSGIVEIDYDGRWTVCGDIWDINAAAVVCRELDCGRAVIADGQALFGEGSYDVFPNEVKCKGEESSITQCIHPKNVNDCHGTNKAGVICSGMRTSFFPFFPSLIFKSAGVH